MLLYVSAAVALGLNGCGSSSSASMPPPQTPTFTVAETPGYAISVAQGGSVSFPLTTTIFYGFDAGIALSASVLPTGITAAFSPASIAAPGSGSSKVTLTADATAATGTYMLQFTGTGGGLSEKGQVSLTVTVPGAKMLVGYLPDYDGSYADFAASLNFNKMTHLDLAFGDPPVCGGACTASSDMTFSLVDNKQSDAEITALVTAAHTAGVKVILSIGGGGTDQQIIQFYNAGLSSQLVASLNTYVTKFNLDGVDLDIEDPSNMGTPYATFAADLISTFHPQNKIVTAAVAEYLMANSSQPKGMLTSTLPLFDFLNVMNYSNLSDAQTAMTYFSSLGEPASQMTLGVPFFGQSADGNTEETYATILAAYPSAGSENEVSGGSLDGGLALYYVGDAEMAQETQLGAQYGGVMIWELSQDAAPPNSLLTIIQNNL
ncbi:MAG: glycosyl hydrolase family 18 protein [Terracidiphilus sp.]